MTLHLLATPTLIGTCVGLASFLATEVFAWQGRFHPSLGAPLTHLGIWPIYMPFMIWQWAWVWGWSRPHMFQVASLVFAAVAGGGILLLARRPHPQVVETRWATWMDLVRTGLFARHGVVLGRYLGRMVRYNGDLHTLVVAPPGTGKTTCVVIPTALTWRHSLVIHDPKREVYPLTVQWRQRFSRVIVLDPTSPTSDCFNPLTVIRRGTDFEMRDVALITEILVDPEGDGSTSAAAQHFREMADQFLQALVLHGLYTGRATTLAHVDRLFVSEDRFTDLLTVLATTCHTPKGPHPAVARTVNVLRAMSDRELSGILSTTSRALRLTSDPLVARMTGSNSFSMADLRERFRPCTVYLHVPYSDQQRLRPVSRLLVRQMLDYMTQRLDGWRWRCLMLLDEVQTLNRMPAIPQALNFTRGYGLNVVAITPSLHELDRLYGTHHSFIESTHVRVVFTPNDPEVAARFSRMTGRLDVETAGQRMPRSQPLLSETGLMHLPADQALVLTGDGGFPVMLTKTPYYASRRFTRRSAPREA